MHDNLEHSRSFSPVRRLFSLAILLALFCVALVAPLTAQDNPPPPSAPTVAPLPTRMPRPAPSSSMTVGNAKLELFFQVLPQGNTGLLHVSPLNGATIANVRARFQNTLSDFFT